MIDGKIILIKIESIESLFERLKNWINEDYEKNDSMNNSINDIESKISSAQSRID